MYCLCCEELAEINLTPVAVADLSRGIRNHESRQYHKLRNRPRDAGVDKIQGCSGAGTREGASPHFFRQGGRVPGHPPPLFWTEFRAKVVHCCNWLLTETQCKIISVQYNMYVGLNCLKIFV